MGRCEQATEQRWIDSQGWSSLRSKPQFIFIILDPFSSFALPLFFASLESFRDVDSLPPFHLPLFLRGGIKKKRVLFVILHGPQFDLFCRWEKRRSTPSLFFATLSLSSSHHPTIFSCCQCLKDWIGSVGRSVGRARGKGGRFSFSPPPHTFPNGKSNLSLFLASSHSRFLSPTHVELGLLNHSLPFLLSWLPRALEMPERLPSFTGWSA